MVVIFLVYDTSAYVLEQDFFVKPDGDKIVSCSSFGVGILTASLVLPKPPQYPSSTLMVAFYNSFEENNLIPAWKFTFEGDFHDAIVRNGTDYWILRVCGSRTNWIARIEASGRTRWRYEGIIPAKDCTTQFALKDDVLLLYGPNSIVRVDLDSGDFMSQQNFTQSVISVDLDEKLSAYVLLGNDTDNEIKKFGIQPWKEVASRKIAILPPLMVPPRHVVATKNDTVLLVHSFSKLIPSQKDVKFGASFSVFNGKLLLSQTHAFDDMHILRRPLVHNGDLVVLMQRDHSGHNSIIRITQADYQSMNFTQSRIYEKALYFTTSCYTGGDFFAVSDRRTIIFYAWYMDDYTDAEKLIPYVVISLISMVVATVLLLVLPFSQLFARYRCKKVDTTNTSIFPSVSSESTNNCCCCCRKRTGKIPLGDKIGASDEEKYQQNALLDTPVDNGLNGVPDNQIAPELGETTALTRGSYMIDDIDVALGEKNTEKSSEKSPAGLNIGLAFSGGGIRSASFMVGVLRYLCRTHINLDLDDCLLLSEMKYLSTVSGGGYTGSGFLTFLNDSIDPTDDTQPDRLEKLYSQISHPNDKESTKQTKKDITKLIQTNFSKFERNFQANANFLFGNPISMFITISSIIIGPVIHILRVLLVAILFGKFIVSNIALFDFLDRFLYPWISVGFGISVIKQDILRGEYTSFALYHPSFWYTIAVLCVLFMLIALGVVGVVLPWYFHTPLYYCCCQRLREKSRIIENVSQKVESISKCLKPETCLPSCNSAKTENICRTIMKSLVSCFLLSVVVGLTFFFLLGTGLFVFLGTIEILLSFLYLLGQIYTSNYQIYVATTIIGSSFITYPGYLGTIVTFAKGISQSLFMSTIVVIFGIVIGILPHILLISGCMLLALFDIGFGMMSYWMATIFAVVILCVLGVFEEWINNIVHRLYRANLQRSFYKDRKDLSLMDLPLRPEWISNTTANALQKKIWNHEEIQRETTSDQIFIFSRDRVGVLGFESTSSEILRNYTCSQAMALSGAAVSTRMGKLENSLSPFFFFRLIAQGYGLNLGTWVYLGSFTGEFFNNSLVGALIMTSILLLTWPILFTEDLSDEQILNTQWQGILLLVFICLVCGLCILIATIIFSRGYMKGKNVYLVHPWIRMIYNLFAFKQTMYLKDDFEKVDQEPNNTLPNYYFLTDGGHLDNLGIYSLLHKRCKKIYAFDAEEDADIKLSSLHSVLDLAIRVERIIKLDSVALCGPDGGECIKIEDLRMDRKNLIKPYAKSHIIEIKFTYNDPTVDPKDKEPDIVPGIIYYGKANLIPNDSMMTRLYSYFNPKFPHDPTANQLFDANLFTAYSGLGFDVANQMFRTYPTRGPLAPPQDVPPSESHPVEEIEVAK